MFLNKDFPMNTIEQAINQAKTAAANISSEANSNLGGGAMVNRPNTSVARAAPFKFNDLSTGQLNVVTWLKIDKYGLHIGSDRSTFDELLVAVPLREVAYCQSVRFGNPAQYRKSYDGMTDSRGGSWAQTVMEAQKIDSRATEFRSADIPFYALEDISSTGKDAKVLVKTGDAIGHSLAVTAWKGWSSLLTKLSREGVDVDNDILKIRLGFTPRKNDKGEWGEFVYNDVEVLQAMPWDLN